MYAISRAKVKVLLDQEHLTKQIAHPCGCIVGPRVRAYGSNECSPLTKSPSHRVRRFIMTALGEAASTSRVALMPADVIVMRDATHSVYSE